MLLIGAISSGENVAADEASDALISLNDMIDSWSNEGLLIFQSVRETFPLVVAQSSYTIGTGGDFNTSIPQIIESAAIIDSNSNPNIEYPMRVNSTQEYAMIPDKALSTNIPTDLYFRRGVPLSTITLYPVPDATKTLALYSQKPLAQYASLNDTVTLPKGYARALRYNLALELAPEYGKEPAMNVQMVAKESKQMIKRLNIDPIFLKSDIRGVTSGERRPFNIFRGE